MKKIAIDIEVGSNGGYVVTHYLSTPNALQKLGGSKPEVDTLAFANVKDLVDWITKQGGR